MSSDPSNLPVTALSTLLKKTTYDPYLSSLLEHAERTFRSARADSTLRDKHDWKMFRSWCKGHGFVPLPAGSQAVILYATELTKNRKRRLRTLNRLAVVSELHQEMHFDSPTKTREMKKFMAGLRRELGVALEQKEGHLGPQHEEDCCPDSRYAARKARPRHSARGLRRRLPALGARRHRCRAL